MRAGLSSIQQTLTPDAAAVLNQSIAEARHRKHGQTTPLHVAATLLASPTGYLRQACIRSHPNSSHPLQCRALELCFTVALERLTTGQNAPGMDPPISNALMAALKRAQAHQRRGCPEQQQQPLLAVKVELEQLIVSILDDPSVSRVMREASFSSPAVKAAIEQTLNSSSNSGSGINQNHVGFGGITQRIGLNSSSVQLNRSLGGQFSPNRNVYLNPRLGGGQRSDEVKKVMEIMARGKKRNPVLVGDSEPELVVKELLRKIQSQETEILRNVEIVSMEKWVLADKNMIPAKIKEIGMLIESKVGSGVGVVLDLGDLKWLVEQTQPPGVSEIGRAAVAEMASLVARFGSDEGSNKVWLIGTATCETYLRCQVYHSSMENDWDLQAVPIASRSPLPGMFPRMLSKPVEPLAGLNPVLSSLPASPQSSLLGFKPVPTSLPGSPQSSLVGLKPVSTPLPASPQSVSENSESGQQSTFCPRCSENYEKEFARLAAIEKSFSSAKLDANKPSLPQWLQNAKTLDESQGKDEGVLSKQKTQELQKKWKDTCLHLHPGFHQNTRPARPGAPALSMPIRAGIPTLSMPTRTCGPDALSMPNRPGPPALSMTSLYNPNLLQRPPFQPKLQTTKPMGAALQLNMNPVTSRPAEQVSPLKTNLLNSDPVDRLNTPPGSPVGTDLVLGRKGSSERPIENQAKDFLSCISEPQTRLIEKFANALDADTYKKLLKGLMEKAWWQVEAATAVASAVTRCTLGNGKRRGGGSRGDVWLLFTGPDRTGKRKMASVLADQICGASPVMINLGSRRDEEDSDMSLRGRTAIDRIAEAVRRNPFSVIMLEDIDEADMLMRGNIKRTIERGKLTDTHGREVGLGNAVFILTGDWSTTNPEGLRDGQFVDEKKLADVAGGDWRLGLIVREKNKRKAHWLHDEERSSKARREMGSGLSLDLNLTTGVLDNEDARTERSRSSSDLTIDHEDDLGLVNQQISVTSVPHDLANCVDDSILFKPVNANFVRREIKKTISVKFSMVVDENLSIEVGDDVLEKIMGGLWHDRTSLEQWILKVLEPSFEELKPRLPAGDRSNSIVRLVVESDSSSSGKGLHGNANWLPGSIVV